MKVTMDFRIEPHSFTRVEEPGLAHFFPVIEFHGHPILCLF